MAFKKSDKIYVGCAKIVSLEWGEIVKVSITKEGLEKMQEHLDNDWVNLDIAEKRNVEPGKPTHSVSINTWKPKDKSAKEEGGTGAADLPF